MLRTHLEDLARPAPDTRARLVRLQAERFEVGQAGIDPGCRYVARLDAAIADARIAYVTAAVAELAALHGELSGRRAG